MKRITFAVILMLIAAPASATVWNLQADLLNDDNVDPMTLTGIFEEIEGSIDWWAIAGMTSAPCDIYCPHLTVTSPSSFRVLNGHSGSGTVQVEVVLSAPFSHGGTIALVPGIVPPGGSAWFKGMQGSHYLLQLEGWHHVVSGSITATAATVPEPSTLVMLAASILTLAGLHIARARCTRSPSPSR